ncbi:methyl-accepting chemotaxis protein [Tenuifilum osseticum]|uniref:methyl-accepting chemotaxis protein n=1 Tax=Tenuifilum osseticum TaxID=3374723 RepID=UPI0034E4C71B
MKLRSKSILVKLSLLVGGSIFLIISAQVMFSAMNARRVAIDDAKAEAVAVSKNYADLIKHKMNKAMLSARAIADALSYVTISGTGNAISREQAQRMAGQVLLSDPDYLGFTLCFEPNAFDGKDNQFINKPGHDETGRFISYLTKSENGSYVIEPLIDYTDPSKAPWYFRPKELKTDFVTEPVYYPVQGKMVYMVSFMAPIIGNDRFIGVTGIDYTIDFIQEMVSKSYLLERGANISILSNEGVIVASTINADQIGKSLKELDPTDYARQIKLLKDGQEVKEEENDWLNVKVPIYVGNSQLPWQVRLSIPMSYITANARAMMWYQISIGLVMLAIGITLLVLALRRILSPLNKLVVVTNRVANGDLSIQMNDNIPADEIGQVYLAMKNMVNNLKEMISGIRDAAESFTQAASQMSQGSQQLSERTNEQASSVEEISSSMEQMVSSIQQNTNNAKETEKISKSAAEGGKKGKESVTSAIKSMMLINEKINIITDIAFQTNILALNAAVEAARAGEHGKGFAVVAAEVRKLAERSRTAADEIGQFSNSSVSTAESAGKQFESIVPQIEKTAELVQEIAAASVEQNAGANQVNDSIQQLNQLTQHNASLAEEIASSAEELNSQAQQLIHMVESFML